MEVRWRLFARDVLSMTSSFEFGRPLRPVRGLRLLGVVVHRSRPPPGAGVGYAGRMIGTGAVDPGGMGILGVGEFMYPHTREMCTVPTAQHSMVQYDQHGELQTG